MKFILGIVLVITSTFALFGVVVYGMEKSRNVECLKLKRYSEQYTLFYLTEWQAEMCKDYDIDAPIK